MTTPSKWFCAVPDDPKPFWALVHKTDGCWLWLGSHNRKGYGIHAFKSSGRWTSRGAHKVSHLLAGGHIPDGYTIDHLCRVRDCVKPEHLEAVPNVVNIMRGRGVGVINKAKMVCSQGHPYSGENLALRRHGYRECRVCKREQGKRHDAKRRAPDDPRRDAINAARRERYDPEKESRRKRAAYAKRRDQ